MAILPLRYFCSSFLLLPKYDRMHRVIWPDWVNGDKPPAPAAPALFDTAVRLFNESAPRLCIAVMIVSAVPQRPKPALKITDPDLRSATASSASLKSFDLVRSMTGWSSYATCGEGCASRYFDCECEKYRAWHCREALKDLACDWRNGGVLRRDKLLPLLLKQGLATLASWTQSSSVRLAGEAMLEQTYIVLGQEFHYLNRACRGVPTSIYQSVEQFNQSRPKEWKNDCSESEFIEGSARSAVYRGCHRSTHMQRASSETFT